MINKILAAMKDCGIATYRINDITKETAELFFVKKNLDMRRINESHSYAVTVYNDFADGEERFRGFTLVNIHPGMTDGEIAHVLRGAYYAASFVRNPFFELIDGVKEEHIALESDLSEHTLAQDASIMAAALYKPDCADDAFINSAEIFVNRVDERIITSAGTDVSFTVYRVKGEFVVQCKQPEDVEMHHTFSYDKLEADALSAKAAEALETVRGRAKAKGSPKSGSCTVLLSGDCVKDLLGFYAVRSSAAFVFAKYSSYQLGTDVHGGETVGERISLSGCAVEPYSSEGIRMLDRKIIENGEVKLIHGGTRFSRYLGIEPVGDYEKIYSPNGTLSFEEMKKQGACLYCVSFSDFQVDEFTGRFGGEIRLAYLYDGENVSILTGGSINGSLLECQKNITFSTERYVCGDYDGPFAVMLHDVAVAGCDE